jgi:hypothetical protein
MGPTVIPESGESLTVMLSAGRLDTVNEDHLLGQRTDVVTARPALPKGSDRVTDHIKYGTKAATRWA